MNIEPSFFTKRQSGTYTVITRKRTLQILGQKYTSVNSSIFLIASDGKKLIESLETSKIDRWGDVLGQMFIDIKEFLQDFSQYRWEEIRAPFISYWLSYQESEINKHKDRNSSTIWTPTGDYTLKESAKFLTCVMLLKFITQHDNTIFDSLANKESGFGGDFDSLVLGPIKEYAEIEKIALSNIDEHKKVISIIDSIIKFELTQNIYSYDLLDPDYKDRVIFLGEERARELNALSNLEKKYTTLIKSDSSKTAPEKNIKYGQFYDSPYGQKLHELNSYMVQGGALTFEEKEGKKQITANEIAKEIKLLLTSWGFSNNAINRGLNYYQELFTNASFTRWQDHNLLDEKIIEQINEDRKTTQALEGLWNSDGLQLLGIILGVAIGIGFGVASVIQDKTCAFIYGIISFIVSIVAIIFVIKLKRVRIFLIKLFNWMLKK